MSFAYNAESARSVKGGKAWLVTWANGLLTAMVVRHRHLRF